MAARRATGVPHGRSYRARAACVRARRRGTQDPFCRAEDFRRPRVSVSASRPPRIDAPPAAPLANHVLHIVPLRAQEQVRGIHAGRIVAVVADLQPAIERSMGEFKCDPMGNVPPRTTIALPVPRPSPDPAAAGAVDMLPERRGGHLRISCPASHSVHSSPSGMPCRQL